MIGKIRGTLDYRAADHVLIDVGGVGYLVYCSERTISSLPPNGSEVALFTELVVREDLLQLYGFPTVVDREWHKLLTSVQGVGAKAAMAILGTLGADGISRAIALGDIAAIKAAPGIGPKIAQRVANELKEKAANLMAQGDVISPATRGAQVVEPIDGGDMAAQADALSALVNLGYAHSEAATAVSSVATEAETAQDLIRLALRQLAPKG